MQFRCLIAAVGLTFATASSAQQFRVVEAVGLPKAVDIAEKSLGGRAIEADYDAGRYDIDVVRGSELHRVTVDAASGKVVGTDRRHLEGFWRRWTEGERLKGAATDRRLSDILAEVEASTKGRAVEASFEREGGRVIIEVEVRTAAGERSVVVDPRSGTLMLATAE